MIVDLSGQVAVVTGAGKGIGRVIAEALGAAGAQVVCAARTAEQLRGTAAAIEARGGGATVVPTDIAEERQVAALFAETDKRFGRLDVLVNNAGIGIFGLLAETSVEDFRAVVRTNLEGTFLCSREAMKLMIPHARGTLINIASVVGCKGYPNQSAYTASKHGVMGLTKSLAVEAQEHGIRVCAILPGGVDTDMVGAARPDLDRSVLIPPEDIAKTVLFMLSLSERSAIDQIHIRRRAGSPF